MQTFCPDLLVPESAPSDPWAMPVHDKVSEAWDVTRVPRYRHLGCSVAQRPSQALNIIEKAKQGSCTPYLVTPSLARGWCSGSKGINRKACYQSLQPHAKDRDPSSSVYEKLCGTLHSVAHKVSGLWKEASNIAVHGVSSPSLGDRQAEAGGLGRTAGEGAEPHV